MVDSLEGAFGLRRRANCFRSNVRFWTNAALCANPSNGTCCNLSLEITNVAGNAAGKIAGTVAGHLHTNTKGERGFGVGGHGRWRDRLIAVGGGSP